MSNSPLTPTYWPLTSHPAGALNTPSTLPCCVTTTMSRRASKRPDTSAFWVEMRTVAPLNSPLTLKLVVATTSAPGVEYEPLTGPFSHWMSMRP